MILGVNSDYFLKQH